VVAAVATSDEARQALGPGGVEVDVAFIDIHLATSGGPEGGMDLVREFAGKPGAPLFVLCTALKQHAIEAFALDVVDYLLKPFDKRRVQECLERVARRRPEPARPRPPTRIVARSHKGLVFLRPEDVWAFEVSERLTFVHAGQVRLDIDLSLCAIEAVLGTGWLRPHRNWLVRLDQVRALERDDLGLSLVVGGSSGDPGEPLRVPVSRDKAQSVRDALLEGATGIRRG
jgi:DNA-binding LytR/AlgR family response regulator